MQERMLASSEKYEILDSIVEDPPCFFEFAVNAGQMTDVCPQCMKALVLYAKLVVCDKVVGYYENKWECRHKCTICEKRIPTCPRNASFSEKVSSFIEYQMVEFDIVWREIKAQPSSLLSFNFWKESIRSLLWL